MYKKTIVFIALLVFLSIPLFSTVITTNNGDGTTTLKASYVIATTKAVDVKDDTCRGIGWTATVLCGQTMVNAGQCTSGQLNTQVPNPQTCLQAIDVAVITFLRNARKSGEEKEANATIATTIAINNDSDIQP